MIKGAKFWNAKTDDPENDYYSIQNNNALHNIINKVYDDVIDMIIGLFPELVDTIKPVLIELKKKTQFEWCGPETFANIIGALCGWQFIVEKMGVGNASIQLGDHAGCYFHDGNNYPGFKKLEPGIDYTKAWANRLIALYQKLAYEYFNIFTEKRVNPRVSEISAHATMGGVIQLCLLNPAHYRSIKAYDSKHDLFICDDPLYGHNIQMTKKEVIENTVDVKLFYFPPEDEG